MFFDRWIRAAAPRKPIDRAAYLSLEGQVKKRFAKSVGSDLRGGDDWAWDQLFEGLDAFSRSGETPYDSYIAMRHLHMQTKGQSDALYVEAARTMFPAAAPLPRLDSPSFGPRAKSDVDRMLTALRTDGLSFLPAPVPSPAVADIVRSLDGCPVKDDQGQIVGSFPQIEDRPRVFFFEEDLLESEPIRRLILDPLLTEVARRQLGVEPIFESVSVFHTRPHQGDGEVLSKTAQMYHIDRDRLTFLNNFIYLNDIDEQRGPHWFVKTSHADKPDDYWQDRRFSDAEIEKAYDREKIACVTGAAGTAFAANTSAFHKGSPPLVGSRTILQIRFTSSLFGVEARWRDENPFTKEELGGLTPAQAARFSLRFQS